MATAPDHGAIPKGDGAAHPLGYVQAADPGSIGADRPWMDTTAAGSGSFTPKIRNAANTDWLVAAGGGVSQAALDAVEDASIAADAALDVRLDTAEAALPLKAPLASPTFTGTPAAPTAAPGTNTTQVATTAYVTAAVAAGGGGGAHAASHANGGADEVALDASQITTGVLAIARLATGTPDGTKFVRDDGTLAVPAGGGGGGGDPVSYTRRELWYTKNVGATTFTMTGGPASTSVSTPTITNADDTDGVWGTMTTATTANVSNETVNIGGTAARMPRNWSPRAVHRFKLPSSVTTVGYWIGFASNSSLVAATGGVAHIAAFRYFTDTDGTAFWRCVTRDGTTSTETTTTIPVTADTAYTFRVELDATEARFYSGATLVATHTTNLPAAATTLAAMQNVTTLAASAATLKTSRVYVSFVG